MCWATGGRNNTWNDPQTNTIFLCCSCIVFALRQPRTVTCTRKTSKRAWRANWCRLGTLNFSGNTLSSTCPFAHTKIYCLPILSEWQICCSVTLLLCMPTLSCGLATTPSSKCCTGVPSKNTRLQHTCLLCKTLHDTYNCWSKKLLSNEDVLVWDKTRTDSDCCVLTAMQKLLLAIIMQHDRLQHYVPDLP